VRIVVAPDSYKGSVSALGVAQAMERGILKIFPHADVRKIPIVDGGEGTVEALVVASGGQLRQSELTDPLGRRITAHWGILGDGVTAVIEMVGLPLAQSEERDSWVATSFGTGELIRSVLDAGLRRIIIGIGDDASNDGGAGMARALGVRFVDVSDRELAEGGVALARLATVHLEGLDPRLRDTEITLACDVDNPLCGPRGASAIFGPKKGATATMIAELDAALRHYALIAQNATGRAVAELPGSGAGGGLGAGLLLFTSAVLKPGVEIVLEAARFSELVKGAAFVLTGEGRTDFLTAFGKVPVGVAKAAKFFRVPVFCLSGSLGDGADETLSQGIDAVLSICDRPMGLDECMSRGAELIEAASVRLCRILSIFI
jgi:glycerate kinase